ncbi:hypothetical protein ACMWKN_05365 [Enterobacter sp. 01-M-05-SI-ECC]
MAQMSQTAMSVYKDDPQAREMWMDMLKKKMDDGDSRLIDRIMKAAGWDKPEEIQKMLDDVPNLSPEERQNYKAWAKHLAGDKAE